MAHLRIYNLAKGNHFENRDEILNFVRDNTSLLTAPPQGNQWSILSQVIFNGNVELFKEIIQITGVHFNLNETTADGLRFADLLRNARSADVNVRDMEMYMQFLNQWDEHCEYAKSQLETTNQRLWAWLRRNAQYCYRAPPSRKWSIAMQVVYHGNVEWLETLLRICPPRFENVWLEARGNDGMTLLGVAEDMGYVFPQMVDFVRARAHPERVVAPVVREAEVEIGPLDNLEAIGRAWHTIVPAKVKKATDGVCPIIKGDVEPLYGPSMDCTHGFSQDGLCNFVQTTLASGPFPARCPGCIADGHAHRDRGIMTRRSIKGLTEAQVISEIDGQRLLLQQVRSIADEASLDWQFAMSKPCPFCATPIAHYKGHGCHHIMPGSGCPSCHNHFCYTCLGHIGDGPEWHGCPVNDRLFCDENCDCPTCPDCQLGVPCGACDGLNSACPACNARV